MKDFPAKCLRRGTAFTFQTFGDCGGRTRARRAARFSEAEATLARAESSGALDAAGAMLPARVFLVREPAHTLVYLTDHREDFTSKALRPEATLLRGAAYARSEGRASAATHLGTAQSLSIGDPVLSSEVRYQQALSAWMQRKLDTAERILSQTDSQTIRARPTTTLVTGLSRRATAVWLGRLHPSQSWLRLSFRAAQPASSFGHTSSAESPIWRANSTVQRCARPPTPRFPKVPWTANLADSQFTALRAVGWCHALEGDYFNAVRRLKEATLIAPTTAPRLISLCDRAYLARCLGENRWAEQERNDARELAATVDWRSLDGEERFALCLLAELFAEDDGPLALAQIAEYRKIGKHFDPLLASADDRRVAALEAYSLGAVQRGLGETAEAIRLISEAYKIYDSVQYRWRAGRAAQALADLTGEAKWTERAKNLLGVYPQSWLVGGAPPLRTKELPGVENLTPAQRTVYDLLIRGLSARQISERLGRSEFTVRNHVKAVFKCVNVRSRASLLALATAAYTTQR